MKKTYVRSLMPISLAQHAERIRREQAVRPLLTTEKRDLAMIEAEQRRRVTSAQEQAR